ncbi:hypothetical protein STEG23_017616, partial [Scotinomys teguina]
RVHPSGIEVFECDSKGKLRLQMLRHAVRDIGKTSKEVDLGHMFFPELWTRLGSLSQTLDYFRDRVSRLE